MAVGESTEIHQKLAVLKEQWSSCTKCTLGARRMDAGGHFVFGEGVPRSIMIISDAPGEVEAFHGRAFTGPAGDLIHGIMKKLNCSDYYVTSLVACRSCVPAIAKDTGLPITKNIKGVPTPQYYDSTPMPLEIQACQQRLYEEIYNVDPVVILTLGVAVAETLLGHSVTITRDRGRPVHIKIPGRFYHPSLTDVRQVWGRKREGRMVFPVLQNELQYLTIPTMAASFVMKNKADLTSRGPFNNFLNDIKLAVRIYEKYLIEVRRVEPNFKHDADFSEMESMYDE